MSDLLLKLGDYSKPKPRGYIFTMDEWVYPIDISHPDVSVQIDPKKYFVTSGEAVTKSTILENDLWECYNKIIKLIITLFEDESLDPIESLRSNKLIKFDSKLQQCLLVSWKSACQARFLTIHLTEARGTHLFLETDWHDGNIICYPKNPRGVIF